MSQINGYYSNAELSVAAYADLFAGISGSIYTDALENEDVGMSSEQAKEFASNWRVIDQQSNTSSGFSATVFESVDNPGEYVLAIRGSESIVDDWQDWVDANTDIVLGDGIAIRQAIDLFNYYQRLTATDNEIIQYEYIPEVVIDGPFPEVVPAHISSYTISSSDPSVRPSELGALAGKQFSVTGHSLGGHLAMIMERFDPAHVSAVYTYNAPGFDFLGSNTEWFFDESSGDTILNS